MALLVDRQRPTTLDALDYHIPLAQSLKALVLPCLEFNLSVLLSDMYIRLLQMIFHTYCFMALVVQGRKRALWLC